MDPRMSRANKAKGRDAENAVCDYLNANGYHTERRRQEGVNDRGDVAGLPGVVIEVKNTKQLTLSQFVTEATREAENDGNSSTAVKVVGVAWIKKRGTTDPGQWYVAMNGDTFLQFLNRYMEAQ